MLCIYFFLNRTELERFVSNKTIWVNEADIRKRIVEKDAGEVLWIPFRIGPAH